MSTKTVATCLVLASGLALAGCSEDPQAEEQTPSTPRTSAPAEPTWDSAEEPRPAQEDTLPVPRRSAPAAPQPAFSDTPEGQQYAGTVTGVDEQRGGSVVHRLTADVNDRSVAVRICQDYQSAMATGQEQIDVVDTAGQLLASTTGDPKSCRVEVDQNVGAAPFPEKFSYDEALAAWQSGVPYYDAFCLNYTPVSEGGRSQCQGIENGTVDSMTGEYTGG